MAPQTIAVINGTARTLTHLAEQALAKGDKVRAVVRSGPRFLSKVEEHENLSVHEWADFGDLATLAKILDGVDVVYVALIALGKAILEPVWLNRDVVISVGTVLRDQVALGSRSSTKVVLLGAGTVRPDVPRIAIAELLLGHQFNDLRAAGDYLLKQSGWLDWVILTPGKILDSESSQDEATVNAVTLQATGKPARTISYARLAAAMQLAASQPEWAGKFLYPMPTSKVPRGIGYSEDAWEIMWITFVHKLLPAVTPLVGVAMLGACFGYVLGVREQGSWLSATYGINLRS